MRPGSRTRSVFYSNGISGKPTAYLRSSCTNHLPHVLLLTDSNGRNLVKPKKVVISKSCEFNFSVCTIPGGKLSHGIAEISHGTVFKNVDLIILALGTNDLRGSCASHARIIEDDLLSLLNVVGQVYVKAKVVLSMILPQTGTHAGCVTRANDIVHKVGKSNKLETIHFHSLDANWDNWANNDNVHLSDLGLTKYLALLGYQVQDILNKDSPTLVQGTSLVKTPFTPVPRPTSVLNTIEKNGFNYHKEMATNSRNTSCKQQATFASVAASYSKQQERHGKIAKYSSTKLDLKDKKDSPTLVQGTSLVKTPFTPVPRPTSVLNTIEKDGFNYHKEMATNSRNTSCKQQATFASVAASYSKQQ
ncbi:uncharacterized protein LOC144431937 [Styela clava]